MLDNTNYPALQAGVSAEWLTSSLLLPQGMDSKCYLPQTMLGWRTSYLEWEDTQVNSRQEL